MSFILPIVTNQQIAPQERTGIMSTINIARCFFAFAVVVVFFLNKKLKLKLKSKICSFTYPDHLPLQ